MRFAIVVAGLALLLPHPGEQRAFRAGVDVVELPVSVTRNDRPVAGLTVADFELRDNGVRQTILDLTYETVPIDVTLVVDASASVEGALLRAIVSAAEQIRTRLRDDDRLAILEFSERVRERLGLTTAGAAAAVDLGPAAGWTSINDAIATAVAMPPPTDRRQMAIVFTDGFDTMSFLDEAAVVDIARRSRTAVFIVAAAASPTAVPKRFFDELARVTGGLVEIVPPWETTHTGNRISMRRNTYENFLDESFVRAFEAFRTSYVLRYSPDGVAPDGWHDVTVRVTRRGRHDVRSRTGYQR